MEVSTIIVTETRSQAKMLALSMTTLIDHKTTLKYLAYLGYEGDTRTALKVTRPKRVDRKKGKIQRNVFLCYVLGAPGSGKVRPCCVPLDRLLCAFCLTQAVDFTVKGVCEQAFSGEIHANDRIFQCC